MLAVNWVNIKSPCSSSSSAHNVAMTTLSHSSAVLSPDWLGPTPRDRPNRTLLATVSQTTQLNSQLASFVNLLASSWLPLVTCCHVTCLRGGGWPVARLAGARICKIFIPHSGTEWLCVYSLWHTWHVLTTEVCVCVCFSSFVHFMPYFFEIEEILFLENYWKRERFYDSENGW